MLPYNTSYNEIVDNIPKAQLWIHFQKSVILPLYDQSPFHLSGSFFGPPTSPVFGFISPSNSGGAPLLILGCNSSPCPSAWTLVLSSEALSWSLLEDEGVDEWPSGSESVDGDWFTGTDKRGVLNAPVDARCSSSKRFCSASGSRGGAGPLPNGELRREDVVLSDRYRNLNLRGDLTGDTSVLVAINLRDVPSILLYRTWKMK